MSETLAHTQLVGLVLRWIKSTHSETPGFCIFCDCPSILETEKPSAIEGFFPDICALSTPPAVTVLGEAKTLPDLESSRSYKQFLAFLRFLAARPEPHLVLATPWQAVKTAKCIIAQAKRETKSELVTIHFLTDQSSLC